MGSISEIFSLFGPSGTLIKPFSEIIKPEKAWEAAKEHQRPRRPESFPNVPPVLEQGLWDVVESLWRHEPLFRSTMSQAKELLSPLCGVLRSAPSIYFVQHTSSSNNDPHTRLTVLESAVDLLDKYTTCAPLRASAYVHLAAAHRGLPVGDRASAMRAASTAVQLYHSFAQGPNQLVNGERLAETLYHLASDWRSLRQIPSASDYLKAADYDGESVRLRQEMYKAHPSEHHGHALARALYNYALDLRQTGRAADGCKTSRESIQIVRTIFNTNPTPLHRAHLADMLENLASAHLGPSHVLQEALGVSEEALRLRRELHEGNPNSQTFANAFRRSQKGHANAQAAWDLSRGNANCESTQKSTASACH